MAFQDYLSQRYQGHESFLENIIYPIFGEANYETAWDVELLDSEELQNQATRTGIRSILRCGTINLDLTPIEVFDITVADRMMMDKNRVGVQAIIRRVMDTYSGAFMLIHYDNDVKWDWRFTFCQLKDKGEFTDNKRYTYLLGPNQSCRTAAQNFQKLADLHEDITIKDIVAAFDVEALSKAFFDDYKRHYERFVEYITGKRFVKERGKFVEKTSHDPHPDYYPAFGSDDKVVRDYTKLLLARIVFLHFLQKKGWLGVPEDGEWGEGDEQFMLHLYQKASEDQKEDFLESVLEPLFFDALNGDRTGMKDVFDTKVMGKVRVPYLNGGLFSRDSLDEIVIRYPKELFSEFLDFLYQYNFTIDENDPNEAQVGIDPEMLGKIFENLLEDNKDKGAFYTPKEIVQYMCQESLVAYLVTKTGLAEERLRAFVKNPDVRVTAFSSDEQYTILGAILNVKICDPAIGSGAFPIGLLNELVRCKEAIYGDEKGRAEIKKEIIRDNIYGVDIEKGAVDIARLRFWLSLIVDEEEPLPLPNLDFKIMQGDSLLENYEGFDLSGLMVVEDSNEEGPVRNLWGEIEDGQLKFTFKKKGTAEKLQSLIREYYSENQHAKKQTLYDEIQKLVREQIKYNIDLHISKHEIILEAVKDRIANNKGIIDKERKKLEAEEQAIKTYRSLKEKIGQLSIVGNNFFLWHTWYNEVFANNGGFDIVIGNPPYVEHKKLKGIASQLRNYALYSGTADLSVYFLERGMNLTTLGGQLIFITTNKFFNTGYGQVVRRFLSGKHMRQLINFEQVEVFEDILVSSVILNVINAPVKASNEIVYEKFYQLNAKEFKTAFVEKRGSFGSYPQKYLTEKEWSFSDTTNLKLKEFIEKDSDRLGDIEGVNIYRGITTGYNPAFIIDEKTKNDLLSKDSNNTRFIKSLLQGRNIRKWFYNEGNEYLIQTGFDIDIPTESPTIFNHLSQYSESLKERSDQGRNWWNLRACQYYDEFEAANKIMWGLTADKWAFTIDTHKHYCPSNAYILTSTSLPIKYLLGILNSRLMQYYFSFGGVMTAGGAYTLKAASIATLPIKLTSNTKTLEDIVAKILSIKASDNDADISELENKMNKCVYDIYGIKDTQIEIIENAL